MRDFGLLLIQVYLELFVVYPKYTLTLTVKTDDLNNSPYSRVSPCYLCVDSPRHTIKQSVNINLNSYEQSVLVSPCFPTGAKDLFCDKTYDHKNRTVDECSSLMSILPPFVNQKYCHIQIFNNNGQREDMLIIGSNGSISSTNNSWYAEPLIYTQDNPELLKYSIYRRIRSQHEFEGKPTNFCIYKN